MSAYLDSLSGAGYGSSTAWGDVGVVAAKASGGREPGSWDFYTAAQQTALGLVNRYADIESTKALAGINAQADMQRYQLAADQQAKSGKGGSMEGMMPILLGAVVVLAVMKL